MTEAPPPPYNPYTPAAIPRAPEGTKTTTAWIWLVVLLPVVQLIPLLFIDWSGFVDSSVLNAQSPSSMSTLGLVASPGYLVSSLAGWVIYGLCALFAYLDWKQLRTAGIPQPFHFAWVFLSSLVYVIGRAVVIRRRTGSGSGYGPMWVAIGTVVLSFVVAGYITASIIGAVISQLPDYGTF